MAYTSAQKEMICKMTEQRRFPVARFELHRDGEPEFYQILLDHVSFQQPDDTLEAVKARTQVLSELMERGIIFADYSVKVWVQGDFDIYYRSQIYADLCHEVLQRCRRDAQAAGELPYLRKGYISFTSDFLQRLPR